MVLNATFNNISVISWWSVLLVEEIGVPGENHRAVASHWQTLWHISTNPCSFLTAKSNSSIIMHNLRWLALGAELIDACLFGF
jgi:hypothetical protein